jgi:acyl-CoA thioester hydrolase
MSVPARAVSGWRDGWYVVPWEVTFRDLDAIGHVNNAVYFTYFETARTRYWFDLTGGRDPFDVGFIVARAECDFHHQLEMEPIDLCVRIDEMRNTSLVFISEIRKSDGGHVVARGKVIAVLYEWKQQSKIPISDEFRRRVQAFQQMTKE